MTGVLFIFTLSLEIYLKHLHMGISIQKSSGKNLLYLWNIIYIHDKLLLSNRSSLSYRINPHLYQQVLSEKEGSFHFLAKKNLL